MMKYKVRLTNGFALPLILVTSIAVLIVITALLAATSTSFGNQFVTHYQKMADEAAEAGAAYASSCMTLSPTHAQTWTSSAPLKTTTDCTGAMAYASNPYVYSDSTVRTYFSVGNLDYTAAYGAQVSSTGYAQVLNSAGAVTATYTSIQKKLINWASATSATMSAAGIYRTCAVVNGSVFCWGQNDVGQLGNNSTTDSLTPVKVYQGIGVMAGKTIVKIFAAHSHTCALSSDGNMYCWGYNGYGQLGNGTMTNSSVPVKVGGALSGKTITDIGGSEDTSCAISGGKIYCWGRNYTGQVGDGTTTSRSSPVLVSTSKLGASYVATELSTSGTWAPNMCAITTSSSGSTTNWIYCWGANGAGQIGNGVGPYDASTNPSGVDKYLVPTAIADPNHVLGTTGTSTPKTITAVSLDGSPATTNSGSSGATGSGNTAGTHICMVAGGGAYCWGNNALWNDLNANDILGQLGSQASDAGQYTSRWQPVPVDTVLLPTSSGKTVKDIQAGQLHTCALTTTNAIYCWGSNALGQLGIGSSTVWTATPSLVTSSGGVTSTNVASIGAGGARSCAIVNGGRTYCWGLNDKGQVGDGTTNSPIYTPAESVFLRVSGNQYIF